MHHPGGNCYDAAGDGEHLFGHRIAELRDDADGVLVTFGDGTVRPFDLVVGADGPDSGVRRLTFGAEDQFVSPVGGHTAWFTAPDVVGLDGRYAMSNEPDGQVVSLRPDTAPGCAKAGLSSPRHRWTTTVMTSRRSAGCWPSNSSASAG